MLLEKLKAKQKDLGLNDKLFAQELGCSEKMWYFTRTAQRGISRKVLSGTVKRFPELIPDVLVFLGEYADCPEEVAS